MLCQTWYLQEDRCALQPGLSWEPSPALLAPNPCPRTGFSPCTPHHLLIATKAGFGASDGEETDLPQIFIHPRGEKRRRSLGHSGLVFSLWGQSAWAQILALPLETSSSWTEGCAKALRQESKLCRQTSQSGWVVERKKTHG